MTYQEATYWENRYRSGGNSGLGLSSEREFLVKRVKEAADEHSVQSILDVGVGTGELARMFLPLIQNRNWPWHYTGIDISKTAISRILESNHYPHSVTCMVADIVEKSFSPRDMVVCFNVHYHMATDERATKLIKNVLDSAVKVVLFLTWNERILEREPLGAHCFYRPFALPDDSNWTVSHTETLPDSPHKTLYTLTRTVK